MTEARQFDADVIVVGAGPVGLSLASMLGLHGVKTILLERGDELIDYPRAVGMDDECLRTLQGIGMAEAVLPHLTPYHWMRFVTGSGRCFASIEPRTDEFGWSRRNAFNQPLVDRVLLDGLQRFSNVEARLGSDVMRFEQDADGVTLDVKRTDGSTYSLRSRWLVGSDGGRSPIRTALNVGFGGFTDTSKWLVVDVRNDPLGVPNIYLHCDPSRPYVSVALPDSIRRFEFMIFENESEEEMTQPHSMAMLMAKVLPPGVDPNSLDYIRKRVYTHNARIADRWKVGRVMLAGDAAHIMPVWQGQGYNTGMRDAANLGWKLAYVVKGIASEKLLETYQLERPPHAKAMIDLSVTAGRIFSPRNRWVVAARDFATWALNLVPPLKRYFTEMRFKPMPKYEDGLVVRESEINAEASIGQLLCQIARKTPLARFVPAAASGKKDDSPVGKLFIQPRVRTRDGEVKLLDDVLGSGFALVCWGVDPSFWLDQRSRDVLAALGARIITAKPVVQIHRDKDIGPDAIVVGDEQMRLKEWFGSHSGAVAVIRPDRFVAGLAYPAKINELLVQVADKMGLNVKQGAA
ncbi:bifunctional 3-(3-hydroxy-phenyl)propionate/3-hydroxycinnamic acid hydroxylase MhpA [Thauera sinica]|uniref:Bifunctional 3-(3-hydroxy-phenyl)propionate/3-hydroxycinnamic acid hydroxylase n=1 Tax=Thauera sinica TaxID=2665146 RepID=A0ABW1ARZ4_9RHOO|nr:bifunctional 3-(3-hydroxy-phenyl)propionate/3-hydroxycinnamic acid hydroxylase [Thauera sp. K11]ATE61031.1 3-(3-hydroxyphenyl)propionate hydroxylase [Thauera sp. K11]